MKARILVIEDNQTNLDLMTYALVAFGHEPLTATDGQRGIDLARQVRPELILCDIQMPVMNGYEVARVIKADESLRQIPLVAVTAFAMVGDREKVLAAGFDDYISKPVDPQTLAVTIERVLQTAQTPPPAPAPPARARVPATILVLDDLEINLELKRGLLEPLGYSVVTAKRVSDALALARERAPDLILSDVGLNEDHGFDFIRQVKSDPTLRDIPFIFLTSTHNDEAWRQQGLGLGATRFLFRPIDPADLLVEIQSCLS